MPVKAWLNRHGLILAIFIAAVLLTDAYYLGDTADYVGSVLGHSKGNHNLRWDPLWDFGHVLWRPVGLVALNALQAISPDGFGLPPYLLLTRALIAINILCAAGLAVLMHSLALSATRSRLIAVCIATGFIVSNAVLNYTQTGNAYITGLFFITLGVWAMKHASDTGRFPVSTAMGGGVAIACAALFWFPFAFVAPAAALIPLLFRRSDTVPISTAIRFTAKAMVTAGILLLLVYGAVVSSLNIRSVSDLKDWIASAGHGVKPGIATNSMRLVFGVPRAFIDMGDDGKLIKRFLFHDPYAPTTVADIAKTAAAPLALFYAALGALLWYAWKSRAGRSAVWIFIVASLPVVFFAVVVFEAGTTERYLPIYPFLALVVAYGLDNSSRWNAHRYLAAALFALITVRSGIAMSHTRAAERQQVQSDRIAPIRQDVGSTGVLILLNYQDDLMHFIKTFPFHPSNRPKPVGIYTVYEPGNARMDAWRANLAARLVQTWDGGGNVWVSKRFIAERPIPEWSWVEGEDARISWARSREFFQQFEYDRESGGEDGFVLLKRSEANRSRVVPLVSSR